MVSADARQAPQAVATRSSLAANARRSLVQQADGQDASLQAAEPQKHRCRVSRCGCVAAKLNGSHSAWCHLAKPAQAAVASSKQCQPPPAATHSKGKLDVSPRLSISRATSQAASKPARSTPLAPVSTATARESPILAVPARDAPVPAPPCARPFISSLGGDRASGKARRRRSAPDSTLESKATKGAEPTKDAFAQPELRTRSKFLTGDFSPSREDTNDDCPYDMPAADKDTPPSPSHVELTEAVLRKSQHLLKQLSDQLALDPREAKVKDYEESLSGQTEVSAFARAESQYGHSPTSKCLTGMETVEVPVVLLKMLSEQWSEMRSPNMVKSRSCAALLDSLGLDEACKGRPGHRSSRSSLLSAASTVSAASPLPFAFESDSEYSGAFSSPLQSSLSMPSTPLLTTRGTRSQPKSPLLEARPDFKVPMIATQPEPTQLTARLAAGPVRSMSPRHVVNEKALQGLFVQPRSLSTTPVSTFQQLGLCRRQSAPGLSLTPTSQISVTATVPPGSSVSVTVTTPHAPQHIQSIQLLTR